MNKLTNPSTLSVAAGASEPKSEPLSYQDYYWPVIEQQLRAEQFGGLKPVVGPTGIGKTSPIH